MLRICPSHRVWIALFVVVAALGISSSGSGALANPSEVQYGYDPIVYPGGSESGQAGSLGPSEPMAPGERVDEASAVVAEILGGTGGKGEEGGVREPGIQTAGVEGRPAAIDASEESSGSNSILFIAILLALSVGLAAWALSRRRSSGGSGPAEMAIRAASFVVFLALIVLLNGSAGSILG